MASNYDSYDFYFTEEGDYVIENGDAKTTEEDSLRSIVQEIQSMVQYPAGSWSNAPDRGVQEGALGKMNTPETAEQWDEAIEVALTTRGLVVLDDLNIQTFPVNWDAIVTIIELAVEPTPENNNLARLQIPATIELRNGRIIYY